MAKPIILPIWDTAETNTTEPDAAHKLDGWLAPGGVPEKPPYQNFNFWQNSVWKWLNEINIKGILGYDNLTDYIADLSYTIGSDGNFYQCKINNGPASSIVNPVGDGTGTWVDVINVTPVTARGYIDGLILENDTDTDHDIKINIGICRDKTDALPIQLTAAMVKRIDANWAAGTGNGGFPSGLTLLADTWYHVFIIMKADGTVDVGFDTSLIATNLLADATNYIYYRRVGSVLTDGSANIYQFIQIGDTFIWDSPIDDYTLVGTGTAQNLATMRSPLGISCWLHIMFDGSGSLHVYIHHPDVTDLAAVPGAAPRPLVQNIASQATPTVGVWTNTSSQIAYRVNTNANVILLTRYYIDPRGKDL